jgi:hypothetical protein
LPALRVLAEAYDAGAPHLPFRSSRFSHDLPIERQSALRCSSLIESRNPSTDARVFFVFGSGTFRSCA